MSTEINLGGGGGGGVQGIQGIQGTAGTGSQGLFAQIYIAANISATAPNTNQLLQNFTLDQANAISLVNFAGTNDALQVTEAGRYKVNARFHSYNGDTIHRCNLQLDPSCFSVDYYGHQYLNQ